MPPAHGASARSGPQQRHRHVGHTQGISALLHRLGALPFWDFAGAADSAAPEKVMRFDNNSCFELKAMAPGGPATGFIAAPGGDAVNAQAGPAGCGLSLLCVRAEA